MSAVTIGVGLVAYPFYGRIHDGVRGVVGATSPIRPNWWYDVIVEGLSDEGRSFAEYVHDGHLRTYASWTLGATCALALTGFVAAGAHRTGRVRPRGHRPHRARVARRRVIGAVAVARSDSHIAGVLTLSILGFMVAIFYILASAPDLALTQLVVETLVLVIFLLVIEEIPESDVIGIGNVGVVVRDAVLSVAVGVTAFVTVLVSTGVRPDGSSDIARYYAEQAVPEGGGSNIVNVTLVDFRGFDTLGELARGRARCDFDPDADRHAPAGTTTNSLICRPTANCPTTN